MTDGLPNELSNHASAGSLALRRTSRAQGTVAGRHRWRGVVGCRSCSPVEYSKGSQSKVAHTCRGSPRQPCRPYNTVKVEAVPIHRTAGKPIQSSTTFSSSSSSNFSTRKIEDEDENEEEEEEDREDLSYDAALTLATHSFVRCSRMSRGSAPLPSTWSWNWRTSNLS